MISLTLSEGGQANPHPRGRRGEWFRCGEGGCCPPTRASGAGAVPWEGDTGLCPRLLAPGPDTLGIAAVIRLSLVCDEGLVARDQAQWELSYPLLRLRVTNQWPRMPSAKPPDKTAAPRTEGLGDPGWGAGPGAGRGCPGAGSKPHPPSRRHVPVRLSRRLSLLQPLRDRPQFCEPIWQAWGPRRGSRAPLTSPPSLRTAVAAEVRASRGIEP